MAVIPMIEPEHSPRSVPLWLTVIVIAAGVAGAAWFVRATFFDARPRERIVVLEKGADDGVQKRGDNRWQVRAGNGWLGVDKDPAGKLSFEFRFWRYDFLPADAMDTLVKVQRLVRDPPMAKQINVTPQQLAQFRDIRAQGKVELQPADAERLRGLWSAYESTTEPKAKHAAEVKLVRALDEITRRLEGPASQSAVERAERASQVLKPEQWQQFDQAGAE
jgi:Spy/CpxP family protein refolding chaperone